MTPFLLDYLCEPITKAPLRLEGAVVSMEIRALLRELQPDMSKILNMDKYFSRPQPIGCALRVIR